MSQDPPRPPSSRELRRNLASLKKLVMQQPMDLDARIRIARTLRLMDRTDEAVEHYRTVLRYLAQAGYAHLAIGVARELLQVDPTHAETLLELAKLYARTRSVAGGRIATPSMEKTPADEAHARAGLLVAWPRSTTGVWRAIRPDAGNQSLLQAMTNPRSMSSDSGNSTFSALLQEASLPPGAPPPPVTVPPAPGAPAAADDGEVLEADGLAEAVEEEGPPAEDHGDVVDAADVGATPLDDESAPAQEHARTDEHPVEHTGEHDNPSEEISTRDLPPIPSSDAPSDEIPTDPDAVRARVSTTDEHVVDAGDIEEEFSADDAGDLPPLRARAPVDLPEIPLFEALGESARRMLAQAMDPRTVKAGEVLWNAGDDARSVVVVVRGEAMAIKGEAGKTVELGRVRAGELAGISALLGRRKRLAALKAMTDVEVLELRRDVLERLMARHPGLAEAVREFVRVRLVRMVLARLPVVRDLDEDTREALGWTFKPKHYLDGDELFHAEAELCGLWVVQEGRVEVGRESAHSSELEVVAVVEPGDFLCTVAAWADRATGLAAVARGEVSTVTLSHRALMDLAEAHPDLRRMMDLLPEPGWRVGDAVIVGNAQAPVDEATVP